MDINELKAKLTLLNWKKRTFENSKLHVYRSTSNSKYYKIQIYDTSPRTVLLFHIKNNLEEVLIHEIFEKILKYEISSVL